MTQTPALLNTQWGFFISRLLIFIGMLLVFTSVGALVGIGLVKLIYGVDFSNLGMTGIINLCKENPDAVPALKLFQTVAGSIGMFLIPALLFPKAVKTTVSRFLKLKNPTPYFSWPIAIALMVVSIPMVSWLYQLNQEMKFPEEWRSFETQIRQLEDQASELTKIFVEANTLSMLLLNLLVVAIIPAICEEFFFRGVLQNFVKNCFHNETVAILFAALVFSGFHGQFYGFLPRLFLGIILGYIYATSGNMWVAVLAHFFNNAATIVIMYFSKLNPGVAIFSEEYVFPLSISILSGIMVAGLIWWYKKIFRDLVIDKLVER